MTTVPSRRSRIVALAALLVVAFSACSTPSDSTDISPSEAGGGQRISDEEAGSVVAEPLGTVSSVAELQDAFTSVGGACDGTLEDVNRVKTALGSGVCASSGTVLTIYIDHEAAKRATSYMMELVDRLGSTMILGENWAINPAGSDREDVAQLADALGAQLLQTEATPVRSLGEAFRLEHAAQAYDEADGTRCSEPVDVGEDAPILECEDLTLIVEADQSLPTEADRQTVANELDLDYGAIPIVGKRHIIAVYDSSIDVASVAREIDGTTPSS